MSRADLSTSFRQSAQVQMIGLLIISGLVSKTALESTKLAFSLSKFSNNRQGSGFSAESCRTSTGIRGPSRLLRLWIGRAPIFPGFRVFRYPPTGHPPKTCQSRSKARFWPAHTGHSRRLAGYFFHLSQVSRKAEEPGTSAKRKCR